MQEEIQKVSPIKQRILQFVDYLDISKRDFYKKTAISRGTLENNTGITEDIMAKFITTYPDINPEWLITGNGEMLKEIPFKEKKVDYSEEKTVKVPLIPIEAVAGFGGNDNHGIRYEECEQYAVPEFEKSGVEFVIRVSGSSMYPKYSNGDILACKKVADILFFQWGKVYVIDSSQGALVKRIFENENKDFVTLVSDNKEKYPPFPIPKNDIRSLSIVLGVIRME